MSTCIKVSAATASLFLCPVGRRGCGVRVRAGGRRRGLALALRVGGEKGGRARDRWPQVGAVRYSRGLTRRKHSSSSIPGLRAGGPGRPAPSQTTAPGGAGWVQLLSGSRQRGEVTLKQSKCAETSRWAAASDGLRAPLRARRTSVASASRPCGPLCLGKRWLCLGGRPARAGFTAHFRLLGHRQARRPCPPHRALLLGSGRLAPTPSFKPKATRRCPQSGDETARGPH